MHFYLEVSTECNDSIYTLIMNERDQVSSQDSCKRMGMNLAVISDRKEWTFLYTFIRYVHNICILCNKIYILQRDISVCLVSRMIFPLLIILSEKQCMLQCLSSFTYTAPIADNRGISATLG